MDRSFRVLLASAFGAAIGTLLALQFGTAVWWLGSLLGGLIAYLGYDPKGLARAIPQAYRAAVRVKIWQGVGRVLLYSLGGVLAISAFLVYFLGPWLLAVNWLSMFTGNHQPPGWQSSELWIPAVVCFFVSFTVAGAVAEEADSDSIWSKVLILIPTPLVVVILAIAILVWSWQLSVLTVRFACQLFRLIHSNLRLLCYCDATLGAIVGYNTGNVLIGAFVGGCLGWLNYELISVRWLKLANNS